MGLVIKRSRTPQSTPTACPKDITLAESWGRECFIFPLTTSMKHKAGTVWYLWLDYFFCKRGENIPSTPRTNVKERKAGGQSGEQRERGAGPCQQAVVLSPAGWPPDRGCWVVFTEAPTGPGGRCGVRPSTRLWSWTRPGEALWG